MKYFATIGERELRVADRDGRRGDLDLEGVRLVFLHLEITNAAEAFALFARGPETILA